MSVDRSLTTRCRLLADSARFQNAVLGIILLNTAVTGLETSASLLRTQGRLFEVIHLAITVLFVAELGIRIIGHGGRLAHFFRDGWNVFDFLVVAVSLLPGVGSFATIARIARVLRVARLISVSPKLRLIVGTMTRSIPSLAHVSLLLGMLLYIYAVVGVNLFRGIDPAHWGSLGQALLTLFQMLTLEGWVEIQAASLEVSRWAWLYYASFILVAVFVVVNLFIAVVLNNLDEIREEDRAAAADLEQRREGARAPRASAGRSPRSGPSWTGWRPFHPPTSPRRRSLRPRSRLSVADRLNSPCCPPPPRCGYAEWSPLLHHHAPGLATARSDSTPAAASRERPAPGLAARSPDR